MKNIAYIGIGSNLGDKFRHCNEAVEEIARHEDHVILDRSSFYKTEPWGKEDQDWFINSVIQLETTLDAQELLGFLHDIEIKLKRGKREKWSPRTIDLDILFFNDEVINSGGIRIPHPCIQERRFVLVPLSEICPELVHPLLKISIKKLLEKTKDKKEVTKIERED